jgi:hypothetical protein
MHDTHRTPWLSHARYIAYFHVQHPLKCPDSSLKEPLNTPSGREVAHWNEKLEWHRRVVAGRRSCSWLGIRPCSLDAVLARLSPPSAPFFAGEACYISGHSHEYSNATTKKNDVRCSDVWCRSRHHFFCSTPIPSLFSVRVYQTACRLFVRVLRAPVTR